MAVVQNRLFHTTTESEALSRLGLRSELSLGATAMVRVRLGTMGPIAANRPIGRCIN